VKVEDVAEYQGQSAWKIQTPGGTSSPPVIVAPGQDRRVLFCIPEESCGERIHQRSCSCRRGAGNPMNRSIALPLAWPEAQAFCPDRHRAAARPHAGGKDNRHNAPPHPGRQPRTAGYNLTSASTRTHGARRPAGGSYCLLLAAFHLFSELLSRDSRTPFDHKSQSTFLPA
jgi:hypothetical protein